MSRLEILLVSYFFPPARDTGAQRPSAMAKYLARLGHGVTVLSTRAFGPGPSALETDEGVRVVRTPDLQLLRARAAGADSVGSLFDSDSYSGKPHPLSYAVVPEPLALAWLPWARGAALRLHREHHFDCVLTTSPPESAHAVGRALQRRGVPWVADIRDAWTFEPLRPRFPLALQRRADERLERRWLGAADRVVCVSEPAAGDLRARGIADPAVIPNAWDPDADPPAAAVERARAELDPERTTLLYTGRFGSYGRDPAGFATALDRLAADDPGLAGRLEVVIAGPLTDQERELLGRDRPPVRVRLLGSVARERALALQRAADALLLIAQPTRSQLVNFKLFEYLAARRPILALADGTEAARLLTATGGGHSVRADEPGEIADALSELLTAGRPVPEAEASELFRYPRAAERVAAVLEEAVSGAPALAGPPSTQRK